MSALATDLMARKNSKILALIGTGAQSEFQTRGMQLVRDIIEVRYFDIDDKAMDKFERNMADSKLKLTRCQNAMEAVSGADIITTITACKANVDVIKDDWVKQGVHINAMGGDTIGKTELELSILSRGRIVVEYFDQSFIEGEIQRLSKKEAEKIVYAEMHELVTGKKQGRKNCSQITIFDSVGIALEDYSALRLTYELSEKYKIGEEGNFTPVIDDPKNLIKMLI
jgi:ornithine cyclodeaminase